MKNLIVIGGIKESGSDFILDALKEIIKQSGYTYTTDIADEIETDFVLIKVEKFDSEIELKSKLVFTSTRLPSEIMERLNCNLDISTRMSDLVLMQNDLISWMRSDKHAFCMDYNNTDNKLALYNYNNLNALIGPLKFMFKDYDFSQLVPVELMKELKKIYEPKS